MVERGVYPSELHLKKELTALKKSRFFRDPETRPSWRWPLSSRSVAATYDLNIRNGTSEKYTRTSNSDVLLEGESYSNLSARGESRREKVYLYNWGHHSSKSGDSRMKLDEHNRQAVQGSSDDSLSNPQKVDSQSDTYLEPPVAIFSVRRTNLKTPVRRRTRRLRSSSITKQRPARTSAIPELLDNPSSSLGAPNCIEQYDVNHYCNFEDQDSTHDSTCKTRYASHSALLTLSGSGCCNRSNSTKFLKCIKKDESSYSCTPASTSSYSRYGDQNPIIVGSWEGTTASFDCDEGDLVGVPRRDSCRIPCCSSKRVKYRGCRSWYSPSLSDTLRRKGSSILCGSQMLCRKSRTNDTNKWNFLSKSPQGLPLLRNSCDGSESSFDSGTDELSTNFGELDLEALSRLEGRRWSNCRSQERLELTLPVWDDKVVPDHRSLSQKYRPRSFDEIIGQKIVVHSLNNAILRGRISPAYLFQGPRGTGKTSTARIFAAALNCLSTEDNKPCGFCRECTDFTSGNGASVREVDATIKKGIDKVRSLLKNLSNAAEFYRYKVLIIDECHMLSSKMWSDFIRFLEDPPCRVVLIFITIEPDKLPRAILSRCQKYIFPKIKDADIVIHLRKISMEENLDVELDALDLIASNSDGSLLGAEMLLDQFSLLGERITTTLVNDLVGVVSDEKLLDLLQIAMSSDTVETVRRSREIMDFCVDPKTLITRLAGLIMDIIAGTYQLGSAKPSDSVLGVQSLTDVELDRLQQALKILSDAEKQLRLSSEGSTWFTAALLQLGCGHSSEPTYSSGTGSSSKRCTRRRIDSASDPVKETTVYEKPIALLTLAKSSRVLTPRIMNVHCSPHANPSSNMLVREKSSDAMLSGGQIVNRSLLAATHKNNDGCKRVFRYVSPDDLDEIWRRCIETCHSNTLRQLLHAHGKLVSISEAEGVLIVFIAFGDSNIKSRAKRFLSSITNSFKIILEHNVEVRIGFVPNVYTNQPVPKSSTWAQTETSALLNKERRKDSNKLCSSGNGPDKKPLSLLRMSVDHSEDKLQRTLEICESSRMADESFQVTRISTFSSVGNNTVSGANDKRHEVTMQHMHTEAIDEQRLESAWLQIAEKDAPGSASCLKPGRNQILPQNGNIQQNPNWSIMALAMSSRHWEDELNYEIKALNVCDSQGPQKDHRGGRVDRCAISPSLLHSNSVHVNFDKENQGYESGYGCNGLLCWKNSKSRRAKVKHGCRVESQKKDCHSWFGKCRRKSKALES